ncbi:anti sigma factor C-terminal domain-containing protein [Leuconostoc citreum]|uniref:anti sigma factor C-terminal domain-containing protein n=1 Tax=Leuconostoc citreum TaxID=33964 RepID=UPI0032DEFDAA
MNDNQNFERIIKKEKRKKQLITAVISSIVTVTIGFVAVMATTIILGKQMDVQAEKQINQFNIADLIYSPNIRSTSQRYRLTAMTRATLSSDRQKNIDGYRVAYPEKKVILNLSGPESSSETSSNIYKNDTIKNINIMAANPKTGQKEPIFFNRAYPNWYGSQKNKDKLMSPITPTHEAKTLQALPNTLGEVAITFDKRYRYEDILKMMPHNIMINYYWLGFHSDALDTSSHVGCYVGLNAKDDGSGKLNDQFAGLPDKTKYNDYQGLKKALKSQINRKNVDYIDIAKDAEKQLAPSLKTAEFAGVIVTGRTENLAKLDQLPYTYASNVGITTPIMPYQSPIK